MVKSAVIPFPRDRRILCDMIVAFLTVTTQIVSTALGGAFYVGDLTFWTLPDVLMRNG